MAHRWFSRLMPGLAVLVLTGCVSYSGYGLKPGEATTTDVIASMGEPALRWQEPDGRQQLAGIRIIGWTEPDFWLELA